MNKEVFITVRSFQKDIDEEDKIEENGPGKCLVKDGVYFLSYEKADENGIVKNRIRVEDDAIQVVKHGAVESVMWFKVGEETESVYDTKFGEMDLIMKTTVLDIFIGEEKIRIDLVYELYVNGEFLSNCEMLIEAKNMEG